VGTKRRGELVSYDTRSKQFVPILSGISAFDVTFSADGQWASYASYPEGTLWRSRADGTERLQLTYPPTEVFLPFISPDGKRVAFSTVQGEVYVINIDGSGLQEIAGAYSIGANWSPDGNRIIMTHAAGTESEEQVFDFRTGQLLVVPSSLGFRGGQWVGPDEFVAASQGKRALQIFNTNTNTWSQLVPEAINWAHSLDYKYLYYTTGGAEPNAMRIRIADRKIEFLTSLKNLRRAISSGGATQISVAPDGSPVFTRDLSTEEIYALTVKWP
jgi:WD40 repeat protein